MFDVRYHLFYVITIFLALGFGMLIGASYYGEAQVRQQKKIFETLAAETNKVVQDRDGARDRLAKDEAALEALRPSLVRGKLAGKRVVLIQTGDYADATGSANQTLSDAGASVVATVALSDKWQSLTVKQRTAVLAEVGASDADGGASALPRALAAVLAAGTASSPSRASALEVFGSEGLVTVSGELSEPCALFVLVGGSRDDPGQDATEAALLDGLKSANARVVGCEPSSSAFSSIPLYQSAGVATVDCIDLPLGQLALPYALRGGMGDYGVKATAHQQLPGALGGDGP